MNNILKQNETMDDVVKRLKTSFDTVQCIAPIAYWYENLNANGRIRDIHFSDEMRRMLGYKSQEEFPDALDTLMTFTHPDDVQIMLQGAIDAGTGKTDKYDVQYRIRKADGSYMWCNATGQVVKDQTGTTVGMYGAFIDISDRKDLEQARINQIEKDAINKAHAENAIRVLALADDFESLYDVNLETGEYAFYENTHSAHRNINSKFVSHEDFFLDAQKNNETALFPDDRELVNGILNRDYICRTLEDGSHIEYYCRVLINDSPVWFKTRIVYKDEKKKNIIIGIFNAEEEMAAKQQEEAGRHELLNQVLTDDGVFLIDCVNDTRKTFHDRLSGSSYYKDTEKYSEAFARYVDTFVCAPDYEKMRRFVNPADILASLGDEKELTIQYREMTTGTQRFYQMRIVRFSATEVLQSFRANDAEMVNSLLFEKLKENYFAIFGVDLESGLMRSYKDDPLHVAGEEGEITTLSSTMLNLATHFEGETRAFFERNSDVQKIKDRFAHEDRAEFFYKSPLHGGKWTAVTGIVFERKADGSPSLFCYAFNYLEGEASLLQDMREQLETALNDAQEANSVIAEQQRQAGKAEQQRKEQIAKTAGTESTYIVNQATARFQILSQSEYLSHNYTEAEDFNASFSRYIADDVFEPDRKMVAEAISIPAMVSHLEKEDEYVVRYRDISKGVPRWYEMRAVRLSETEILFGFSDKDEAIITQMMADNFRETYFGLYYITLDSGLAQIIKTGHPDITGDVGKYVQYSELMKNIASASYGDAAEFFNKISDIDFIRKRFADEDFAYHVYKSYIFEGNRWVNYTGRVLQRHDDGTPAIFALALSLLDEEASAKEEANMKLKDALAEAESANRTKTAFVNSFKSLYQVMYFIDLKDGTAGFLYGDENAKNFLHIFDTDYPEEMFENFHKYYVDVAVVPEDRERVREVMNTPNMYRTLKTNSSMSVNYRVRRNLVDPVYTEMSVIKAAEENGELTAIFLAFRLTDKELREALETQKKMEEDARIIGALSEDFSCVDYVEVADIKEKDTLVGIRVSDTMRRLLPDWETIGSFPEKMAMFCEKLVYAPDREMFKHAIRRETVLEKLSQADNYYFNIRLLIDGEVRYYQAKTSAVREGSALVGIVAGIRSVDEYTKKDLEIQGQLKSALDKAESASRAKTDFLFNMSHDIRTPLNVILGFTGMAQKHHDSWEKTTDYLRKIDASGKQLLELINQVLEMSRIESGKVEFKESPINVLEQYNDEVTILAEQAKDKGLEFHHSLIDAVHLNVFADMAKMSSITLNITGNALKYTPTGGRIDYSLREIPSRKQGYATYVFTVADTGIGMSADFLKTLYEPFTREQNSTVSEIQGTGLGLSIVKHLVDLLGGTIEVQSEPGKGTKFDITVDFRINEEVEKKTEQEQNTNDISFKGKRVLVVEDNELNREIASEILGDEGLLVEVAEDGSKAVDILKEKGPGYFNVILMDIQMPVMNGYEATQAIRKMYPDAKLPIIAVSANAFAEDKAASLAAGMNAHVAKPIKIKELLAALALFL